MAGPWAEPETCASAAADAPNSSGATTLAAPNARPRRLALAAVPAASERSPKATPRTTIAITASVNGARRTVPRAANPVGKAENRIVIEKINQTWFASHKGPIVRAIALRCSVLLPQVRSRIPAPKSAPAKTAYAVRTKPEADGDDVRQAHPGHAHGGSRQQSGLPVDTRRTPHTVTALSRRRAA